jgi:hypothetical protein
MEQQASFPASDVSWLGFLCDLLASGTADYTVGPIMHGIVDCVVGSIMCKELTQGLVPFLLDWKIVCGRLSNKFPVSMAKHYILM